MRAWYIAVKLLVVDDISTNRKLLRAALEQEGHVVCEAVNGLEALDLLSRAPVDGVISDVLMPAMDGFRLCEEIRKDSRLGPLPLVLYTSTYNSASDRELAACVGADAYVLKPAPVATLLEALRAASNDARRHASPPPSPQHAEILERYNAVLVRKLESRNDELQQALTQLSAAHERIMDLNRNLETRVAQRTAALDAANRELEAFSYSVSHDLRAPLRHITGFAQLLEAEGAKRLEANDIALVRRVLSSAEQMHRLIDALLALARISKSPLDTTTVDLECLLDEVIQDLAPELGGRSIEWRRTRLPAVRGDATLLRQVLHNLLSNAIKYTRTRANAIIEIGQRSGRADEVVVFVKDNGVGFDVRQASELFGAFKRLHHAEPFEGIGIGLANVHRIITRHGGAVWADAAVDAGAIFFFSLPLP